MRPVCVHKLVAARHTCSKAVEKSSTAAPLYWFWCKRSQAAKGSSARGCDTGELREAEESAGCRMLNELRRLPAWRSPVVGDRTQMDGAGRGPLVWFIEFCKPAWLGDAFDMDLVQHMIGQICNNYSIRKKAQWSHHCACYWRCIFCTQTAVTRSTTKESHIQQETESKQIFRQQRQRHNTSVAECKWIVSPDVKDHNCIWDVNRNNRAFPLVNRSGKHSSSDGAVLRGQYTSPNSSQTQPLHTLGVFV